MSAQVPIPVGASRPRPSRLGAVRTVASFALRELRGGLRGFAVFILCIALGVMAISGVGSFARSLTDGLAREGRVILGGDVAFSLFHREATPQERAFLDSRGRVSDGRHHAGDGARADGRPAGAGRAEGGGRGLSALWPARLEPDMADRRRRWRERDGVHSAPSPIRRCWRGWIWSRAAAAARLCHHRKSAPSSAASRTGSPAASTSGRG